MATTPLGDTEYQLVVAAAKAGDARAFERFCRNWHGLIAKVVSGFTGRGVSKQNLFEEAENALWARIGRTSPRSIALEALREAENRGRAAAYIKQGLEWHLQNVVGRTRDMVQLEDYMIEKASLRKHPVPLEETDSWDEVERFWQGDIRYFGLVVQGYNHESACAELDKAPSTYRRYLETLKSKLKKSRKPTVKRIPPKYSGQMLPGDVPLLIELRKQNHSWAALAERFNVPSCELRRIHRQSKPTIEAREALAA